MKILQINTTVNSGSTGRIAEQIGQVINENDGDSYIAYSRLGLLSESKTIKIGNKLDVYKHVIHTRLFDNHGFQSKYATRKLIKEIEKIKPHIIHLHNIHGYYVHIGELFIFLKKEKVPIVWTFHDCWPFTGHCTYFDSVSCDKWKTQCYQCPKSKMYPESWFFDNSRKNYVKKKVLFNNLNALTIVTPSNWLRDNVKQSFLKEYPANVIHNGIDLSIFKPLNYSDILSKENLKEKKIILGVASVWDQRKGLDDFIKLAKVIDEDTQIVLLGLNKRQLKEIGTDIIGIERTENIEELAQWYSIATVFVNPTYQDNFPTTNIEALACGTPIITYDTGGSPEAIDEKTGIIVEKGDIDGLKNAFDIIVKDKVRFTSFLCRKRAEVNFDKTDRFLDYIKLYKQLIKKYA